MGEIKIKCEQECSIENPLSVRADFMIYTNEESGIKNKHQKRKQNKRIKCEQECNENSFIIPEAIKQEKSKLFECQYCPRQFRYENNFKQHTESHWKKKEKKKIKMSKRKQSKSLRSYNLYSTRIYCD